MFEKLPKSNFKQVHKSFVINKKKLDYIEGNTVIINSNTRMATNAPIGSIRIPSHFNMVATSFLMGRFLSIGDITVGPVTMIKLLNKKEMGQFNPIKKCTTRAAPINVTNEPTDISLNIEVLRPFTSFILSVSPPSNKIIPMDKVTK